MENLKERILEIFAQPQLSGLATITEDGKPWVRYVMTFADEDLTLRCSTFVHSRKAQHIQKNPEVHLTCGVASLADMKPYLQIQGTATLETSQEEKDKVWCDVLKNYFEDATDPNFGVIVIKPYRIEYTAPGEMGPPAVWTKE